MAIGSYQTQVPRIFPGSVAWLDAADTSTITSASNLLSSWRDKSGRVHNAIQATGVNQPSTGVLSHNGLNVLGFDGTNSRLDITDPSVMNSPLTIFMVAQTNTISGSDYLIARDSASGAVLGTCYLTVESGLITWQYRNGDGVQHLVQRSGAIGTAPFIVCAQLANGSPARLIFNNGTPVVYGSNSSGLAPSGDVGIGYRRYSPANPSYYLNGWIGEISINAKYMTDDEVLAMFRQLSNKWGIAIS